MLTKGVFDNPDCLENHFDQIKRASCLEGEEILWIFNEE
jgi:hypothetical protein